MRCGKQGRIQTRDLETKGYLKKGALFAVTRYSKQNTKNKLKKTKGKTETWKLHRENQNFQQAEEHRAI